MSDELIKELRTRNGELQAELAKTKEESIKRRQASVALKQELAEVRAELEDLTAVAEEVFAERDQWQAKAEATPDELSGKLKKLQDELASRDHMDGWRNQIGDQLAPKASIDKLWRETDYKPEGEVPSPEKIKELLGQARETVPYFFVKSDGVTPAAAPGGANGGVQRPPLRVAETPGRGARDATPGQMTYRKSDLAKPGWDDRNPALRDAIANGSAAIVD